MNEALLKRIKVLEEEKRGRLSDSTKLPFCIEQIQHDDKLVQFYTGFSTFRLFLAFFELLALLWTIFTSGGQKMVQGNVVTTSPSFPRSI